MNRICIFGDSLVWGGWDDDEGGWVNRLRVDLPYKYSYENQIYSLGVCGDTTNNLLKRFKTEATVRKPDVIIFQIGKNDAQYIKSLKRNKVSLKKFKNNIQKLIELAKKITSNVAFIEIGNIDETSTRPVPWNKDEEYHNNFIKQYNKIINSICSKNKIKVIPIYGKLSKDMFYKDDGLHPNPKGHKLIFIRVRDFLIKNNLVEK